MKKSRKCTVLGERNTRKCNGAKFCAQGDKQIKEKSAAKWNKGSGDHKATSYPAKFPTCGKELKKRLGSERNHQKQKAMKMYLNKRANFQPQQPEESSSFIYVVLALESRIQEWAV